MRIQIVPLNFVLGILLATVLSSSIASAHWHQGFFGYRHASTLEEGYLRGFGDFLRSKGIYNLTTAMAMRHWQDAYWQYIKNQELRVQTYYELKRIHDAYVNSKRKPAEPEQLRRLSLAKLPARLAPEQWNKKEGGLKWPYALKDERLSGARERLNELFLERFENPEDVGLESENYVEVDELVVKLRAYLKTNIRAIRPMHSTTALSFLKTLAFEATLLPDWTP